MKRALLALLVASSVTPGDARGANAAGGPLFPAESRATMALLLRLTDLPRAYVVGDDSGCGIGTENAPPSVAQIVITYRPEACSIQLEHRRGSPYIESSAVTFGAPDGARAMFAARQDLFMYESGETDVTEQPQAGIGEEASLFLIPKAYGPYGGDRPGAAVVWRRGAALGSVLVARPGKRAGIRMAQRLALRQDARMQHPTPFRAADDDDLEVPIADPRVRVPVHWLGRRFAPRRGLAPLRLAYSYGPERPDEGLPQPRARMEYESGGRRTAGIDLALWKPAEWRRVNRDPRIRPLSDEPCTTSRAVRVRSGHAVIYSGYDKQPRSGRCPSRRHDAFEAVAYFRRVVVSVGTCTDCNQDGWRAPYNSAKGMRAVLRSLHLRP